MTTFHLTPDAKANLMIIAFHTEKEWGNNQRHAYLKLINDKFHALAIAPKQGKSRPEIYHSLRSIAVGKHIIFYIIKQDKVVIVNVLHEKMDPTKHIQHE